MKLPECRRYCRHTKMKTQNWHSANQLHALHFILHPQNEVWPFEILCSVLKCLLLLFQWSFSQWSGRLWAWSTRFTLQLESAFSRSCGEEGARPSRWPQLWSRSIWSSINSLASGIKEGGCKFLWAASRTGLHCRESFWKRGPGHLTMRTDTVTTFFFEFSLKAEISKSPSQTLDSLMIFSTGSMSQRLQDLPIATVQRTAPHRTAPTVPNAPPGCERPWRRRPRQAHGAGHAWRNLCDKHLERWSWGKLVCFGLGLEGGDL